MTIVGVMLLLVGGAAAVLIFTGAAPDAILSLPVPLWAWVVVAVVGLVLIVLNRRPAN